MSNFITENFWPLLIGLMAFLKVVVNLTPSEKDNKVFAILDDVIDALVPNRTKTPNDNSAF